MGWILSQEDSLARKWQPQYSFSVLAWRIPWTEEPGGLQSMGPEELAVFIKCDAFFSGL